MHRMRILCRIMGLILTAQYAMPALANVVPGDYITLKVGKIDMSWPVGFQVHAVTDLGAGNTIGKDSTKVTNEDRGEFYVKLVEKGASDCRISGNNIRLSISTFIDRTNLFNIADNKLSLRSGQLQKITYTKAEANKVTGWLQTYTWYLKEFVMENVKIECSKVTDPNPSFKLNINGATVGLTGKPTVNVRNASVRVPKKIDITSQPRECHVLELWEKPSGNLPVIVKGPQKIELQHELYKASSLTVNQQSEEKYKLCAGNDSGKFTGKAIVQVSIK